MQQNIKKLKYTVAKIGKQKNTTTKRKTVRALRRMHGTFYAFSSIIWE